jgi:hypothetical protein
MTQEEIIEMVMQIGGCDRPEDDSPALKMFVTFANFVADKEREACALICDDHHEIWRFGEGEYSASGPKDCAAAIRARGEA